MASLGLRADTEHIRELFEQFDADGSGKNSYACFYVRARKRPRCLLFRMPRMDAHKRKQAHAART